MFQMTKKRTITLAILGLAGLMSVGVIAAQANTEPISASPTSSSSSTPASTDSPTAPDDSALRLISGNGADHLSGATVSDDVADAPDDSDGRVAVDIGTSVTVDDSSTSGRGSDSEHDDGGADGSGHDDDGADGSGHDDDGADDGGADSSGHGSDHE